MKLFILKTKSGNKYYKSFQNAMNAVMEEVQRSTTFRKGQILEQEINLADETLHIVIEEGWMYIPGKTCKECYIVEPIITED